MRDTLKIRALLALVISLLFAAALYPADAARVRRPTVTQTAATVSPISIPFELANRHIVLKIKVNNSQPLSFVLDTGDKFAIIDLERARALGLKLEGTVRMGGAGANMSVGSFVKEASFTVPGLAGFSQPVTLALPIGRLASRLGQDFDGIIGSDFIEQFVVEIDYESRNLPVPHCVP